MNRISKDDYYINIAHEVSRRSTCLKRHYGCVIVKNDVIVSTGYNGSPRGEINCCDIGECKRKDAKRYSDYTDCCSVHAEQNAIIAVDRDKLIDSTLYLACFDEGHIDINPVPCNICRKMIKNAGIKRIVNYLGDVECM